MKIEKSAKIGFCFGVRRALDILQKEARKRGGIETFGDIVHNEQVLQNLAKQGIRVAHTIPDIRGKVVVLGAHGVTPEVEEQIKARGIAVINTTCPFVHRAQIAARRLVEAGFFVIVYGDADHAEVKGILGWAKDKGIATTDEKVVASLKKLPRRVGILSQTTMIPSKFLRFVKDNLDTVYIKDSEIRIVDTICHDIRERQAAALKLAKNVDVMLVIGGRESANTSHLAVLCATAAKTYKIETADELKKSWFKGKNKIGITAGASTADETIEEIIKKLSGFK
ncbi:MAG: 4-hydroxy-3-methylbut-2-enyl diphosphate reductase [Dehalococcoidales bacterium]|nr:4-hydroxy-3-methylbut-2-enyl diphosphate reductase [Dehalococcoidales bacterium]